MSDCKIDTYMLGEYQPAIGSCKMPHCNEFFNKYDTIGIPVKASDKKV